MHKYGNDFDIDQFYRQGKPASSQNRADSISESISVQSRSLPKLACVSIPYIGGYKAAEPSTRLRETVHRSNGGGASTMTGVFVFPTIVELHNNGVW